MAQVNLVKVEANIAHFDVALDAKEVDAVFREIFRYYSNHTSIPGFRKGKVPPKIIENRLGVAAILEIATDDIKHKAHEQAITESKLKARRGDVRWEEVGQIVRGESVSLKFAAPVMPDVKLPEIAGTEIVFTPQTQDEKMRERFIAEFLQRFAEHVALGETEEVAVGHKVEIKLTSVFAENGEPTPFESEQIPYELGLPDNLPDFDDNIFGMKVGETKTFSYAMPADFVDDRTAGKELQITVALLKAEKAVLPELTDETIQQRFGFADSEAFDRYVDIRLKYEVQRVNEVRKRELALEQVLAGAELEITDDIVAPELDSRVERQELRLRQSGMSLDEMLQKQGRTIREFREELEPSVRMDIKRELVIARAAEVNGIKVSNNDILQEAARVAKRYGIKGRQFKELLKNRDFVVSTVENIFEAKVYDLLVKQVKFITESGEDVTDDWEYSPAVSKADVIVETDDLSTVTPENDGAGEEHEGGDGDNSQQNEP